MDELMDRVGMGWLPDYPDFRDYMIEQDTVPTKLQALGQKDSVKAMRRKVGVAEPKKVNLSASVDLRPWCSPIENQGSLGACTAHAGVGVVEYYERRAFGKHIDASRLFLYKVTRNMLHSTGDTKFKGAGPGLGLTIARGIVEAHGGRIWAESPGHDEEKCPGSKFYVLLPIRNLTQTPGN